MERQNLIDLCIGYVVGFIVGAVVASSCQAEPESIVSNEAAARSKQSIVRIFNEKYKTNPMNENTQSISVRFTSKGQYYNGMTIKCGTIGKAKITFDDLLVITHFEHGDAVVAGSLAHELGHCHTWDKDPTKAEVLADIWGLQLFVSAGYCASDYKLKWSCDDDSRVEGDEHPSDKQRCQYIDNLIDGCKLK